MDLDTWLSRRGGIAHRRVAAAHGFAPSAVRTAIRAGTVRRVRASWITDETASSDLVTAASAGGRLTCLSLARPRHWWIPESADSRIPVQLPANGRRTAGEVRPHWSRPLVDTGPRALHASIEDALAHIALCLGEEDALCVWESAIRIAHLDLESLRTVAWPEPPSRRYAQAVRGRSDSGVETLFVVRLRPWGIPIRQQVRLGGHDVDALIGTHLVAQLDGFAFHSSPAAHQRDVSHDAELQLRGYTVLRFTYAQVVHHWDDVERTIAAALARRLHLAPHLRRTLA
ncbi:endonuclease domain-containing protein [uncultured Microbacterium sp.]|uniref:endonuclease domain-containing protein n=1 Tax=uncultured Microbacterium sp. TaxID=191216 RepID=UPI0025DF2415|nr:DUF559 domain-containing protein [uncultured Microbacterium sp.]